MEFLIALVLAAMLCPLIEGVEDTPRARKLDYLLPVALVFAVAIATLELQARGMEPGRMFNLIIFGPAANCCLRFGARPRRFGLGVAACESGQPGLCRARWATLFTLSAASSVFEMHHPGH